MDNSKKINTLDKRLNQITDGVEEQNIKYEKSRDLLYRNLVDAYFWWQDAKKIDGYLEDLYQAENIKSYNVRCRPLRAEILNLVKLVFASANPDNQLCIRWADAIEAIHLEYSEKPRKACYKRQPKPELIDWIRRTGGITPIAVKAGLREPKKEHTDDYFKKPSSGASTALDKKDLQAILAEKRSAIKSHNFPESSVIQELPFDEGEIAVVLVKKAADGKAEIIGSTDDSNVINDTLNKISVISTDLLDSNLKLLATAISIHGLPPFFQQIDYEKNYAIELQLRDKDGKNRKTPTDAQKTKMNPMRKKFFPKIRKKAYVCKTSKVVKAGKKFKENELYEQIAIHPTPRLLIKSDGSILCSLTNTTEGLTTLITPNNPHTTSSDIFLRGSDRYWIETDLIGDEAIALYSSPSIDLEDTEPSITADKQIVFRKTTKDSKGNDVTTDRNIYFYPTDSLNDIFSEQSDIKDEESIQYDWSIQTTKAFPRQIYTQHLLRWMHEYKEQFRQVTALTMKLSISNDDVSLHSKWLELSKEYSLDSSMKETMLMLGNLTSIETTNPVEDFIFCTTDAIQCFKVASEAALNDVLITGNAHILKVEYQTEFGLVRSYIPASTTSGSRLNEAGYFTRYRCND